MGRKKNKDAARQGVSASEQLLPQLRRIYGHGGKARDIFGRRPALPSEIAEVIRGPANGNSE
jgi:hypothetical protein